MQRSIDNQRQFGSKELRLILTYAKYALGLVSTVIMLLLPKQLLETWAKKKIRRLFYPGWKKICWYKSGRSALHAIFCGIRHRYGDVPVLVPDYICNVVYRAASDAHLQPVPYRTMDDFSVDIDDLLRKIKPSEPVVVLLSSLAGCQNNKPWMLDAIFDSNPKAWVILDECQNLISPSGIAPRPRVLIVYSFNMKQVPGIMGGGVCCGDDASSLLSAVPKRRSDLKLEVQILSSLCSQALDWRKSVKVAYGGQDKIFPLPKIEHSKCGRLDYNISIQTISKISLARAVIVMYSTLQSQRNRRHNYRVFAATLKAYRMGHLIITERGDLAPFIPFVATNDLCVGKLPLKGPYALVGEPSRTIKPELRYFKNEGICKMRSLCNHF